MKRLRILIFVAFLVLGYGFSQIIKIYSVPGKEIQEADSGFYYAKKMKGLQEKIVEPEVILKDLKNKYSSISAFLSVCPVGGFLFGKAIKELDNQSFDIEKFKKVKKQFGAWASKLKSGNLDEIDIKMFLKIGYLYDKFFLKLAKRDSGDPDFKISQQDLLSYAKIVQKMHQKEREFSGYYVFYHGHRNDVTLLFDMISAIREWVELKASGAIQLRLKDLFNSKKVAIKSIKEFLAYWTDIFAMENWDNAKNKVYDDWSPVLKSIDPVSYGTLEGYVKNNWQNRRGTGKMMFYPKWGNWTDNIEPQKSQVLCVNFNPFAFLGKYGENSFYYFVTDRSIAAPKWIDGIIAGLGIDLVYLDRVRELREQYMKPKKGGQILQIFIPKDKVDQFVYIAHSWGMPLMRRINGVSYDKNMGYHTKVSEFLDRYLNDPSALIFQEDVYYRDMITSQEDKKMIRDMYAYKVMNNHQGRILLLPEFFDPKTGIKIERYNFISEENKAKYRVELAKVVDKMLYQWIKSGSYKKLKDASDTKLAEVLDIVQKALK